VSEATAPAGTLRSRFVPNPRWTDRRSHDVAPRRAEEADGALAAAALPPDPEPMDSSFPSGHGTKFLALPGDVPRTDEPTASQGDERKGETLETGECDMMP